QDLAMGFGRDISRYAERKRVVKDKNLGPLVSTDMTRCIHCTRCVRFGQEVAGIMELGMAGRGEHSEILTFVSRTVDSELSGNVIDLCPVGALTSKPFRYTARNWELSRRRSVSAHDSLGSNLIVQTKQERVVRVLPLENESVNEVWISDRDRFAYLGLDSEERLLRPMVKQGGQWKEVDWPQALEAAARGLKEATAGGGDALGTLLAPELTLEELHLGSRLARGLGSDNLDSRVRQSDFRAKAQGAPWLGFAIEDLAKMKSVLLVGSTIRKEQPLLSARLRQAAKKGTAVHLVHVAGDDLLMPVRSQAITRPSDLTGELAARKDSLVGLLKDGPSAIVLGHYAQQHPDFAVLLAIAQEIGRLAGATVGVLPDGANAVGAALVGAQPRGKGLDAAAMMANPRRAYLVVGVEPEHDLGRAAMKALEQSSLNVVLSAYRNAATDRAHVILPITPFTETGGTFVNMEGRAQSFNGAVKPQGDARPGWKVLRMLGSLLGIADFDADSLEAVRAQVAPDLSAWAKMGLNNAIASFEWEMRAARADLERVAEFAVTASDPIVRRSPSLQKTADGKASRTARANAATLARLGLKAGDMVEVSQGGGSTTLAAAIDAALPDGVVRIARGVAETAALGTGNLTLQKALQAATA
ncbi:MAG TPA: molybdopterin-dependent oxidoreductase, partial [Usitatibacter sp.]|nr:molybdopterin-dependent oxidoreductase [Usitatibacter sp.]